MFMYIHHHCSMAMNIDDHHYCHSCTLITLILTKNIIIIDQYWYDHNHCHHHHCHHLCCCQEKNSHHFKPVKRITVSVKQEIALGHFKDRSQLNMSELQHRHATAAHFNISHFKRYIMVVVTSFSVILPFPSLWLGFNVTLIAIAWLSPQIAGNHVWMEMRLSSVSYTHQTTGILTKRVEKRLREILGDGEEEEEPCRWLLYLLLITEALIWRQQG